MSGTQDEGREELTDEQRRNAPEGGKPGATEQAPSGEQAASGGPGTDVPDGATRTGSYGAGNPSAALVFLAPAVLVLGALIIYPTIYTTWRSLYGVQSADFVGLANYLDMFRDPTTLTAIKNNFVWVLIAPTIVTAFGLVFAVLIDRVRAQTAFKTALFMPMAISFLAVGIIFRLVYQSDPDIGLANAIVTGVKSLVSSGGAYPTAQPSTDQIVPTDEGGFEFGQPVGPSQTAAIGLVGIRPEFLPAPEERVQAAVPQDVPDDAVAGTVFFDFSPDGTRGEVDQAEAGLSGITVQAVSDGQVVGSATTDDSGSFLIEGVDGEVTLRLAPEAFKDAATGVQWLGAQQWLWVSAATWSIIGAFIWMWAGFAMVIISAGLSSIPREVMESARVDGATEWQVFRRITVPLLMPVIMVVLVTLMINVLKIFDLVLIMAPGSVQDDATVLALRMWRVSFGGAGNRGLGSAITVFLFLLVVPAMIYNLKRFRTEESQ